MTYTTLEKAVAPDRASVPGDVRLLKRMLNRLGYYTPPDKVGITPFSDRVLFDALKKFQKDNALKQSGAIKPEDDTFDALESALARQNPNTQYIWHTVQDSKTRSTHKSRDGHVFSWGSPPEGGHPGEDYNCRCWATPLSAALEKTIYDPPVERVYPEVILIPPLARANSLLSIGKNLLELGTRKQRWVIDPKTSQLQRKFKHARFFGIKGNQNKQNLEAFKKALQEHVDDPATKVIKGSYRGQKMTHHYNPKTEINVMRDPDGNFISSWKLTKDQIFHMNKNGRL